MGNEMRQLLKFAAESMADLEKMYSGAFEKGMQVIDGNTLEGSHFLPFTPHLPAFIGLESGELDLQHLKQLLLVNYPADMSVYILHGEDQQYFWRSRSHGKPVCRERIESAESAEQR